MEGLHAVVNHPERIDVIAWNAVARGATAFVLNLLCLYENYHILFIEPIQLRGI